MLNLTMLVQEPTTHHMRKKSIEIDESLFYEIGNGNMQALESVYNATERTLYAYLLSLTKNHDTSVDLLQETYLKVMSVAHLYKPQGKPLAWMFTIARNLYMDDIKKKKHEIAVGDDALNDQMDLSYEMSPENRMVLSAALTELTEEERSIILLYAVSGMKHREIGKLLDLNLSTVLSKYHRALKKLKSVLEKGGTS